MPLGMPDRFDMLAIVQCCDDEMFPLVIMVVYWN